MPEQADFALRAVHSWAATLPLDATDDELGTLIRLSRIAALQEQIDEGTLRRFEVHGIRGTGDFRVLAFLRRSEAGQTNSELIDALGGSKAGMSARLERLRVHGITRRIPSQTDRRSHTNVLTESGVELADQLVTDVVGARKLLLSGFAPAEVASLAAMLKRIIETVKPGG